MAPDSKHNHLLEEVLAEGTPTDLREAMLHTLLSQVDRKRRMRRLQRGTAITAALTLCAVLFWRVTIPERITPSAPPAPYVTVRTTPLSPASLVSTRPFGLQHVVNTERSVVLVSTTTHNGNVQFIGDHQLLTLASPRIAALVRTGPDAQTLVFLSENGSKDHPIN